MNHFEQDVISRANEKLASLFQQNDQTVEKTASPFTDAAVGYGLGALSSVGGGLMGRTIGDLLSSTGLGEPSEEDLQKYPDLKNPLPHVMQVAGSLALPLAISLLHGGKSPLTQAIPFTLGSLGASSLLNDISSAATATIDPKGYADMIRSIADTSEEDEALVNSMLAAEKTSSFNEKSAGAFDTLKALAPAIGSPKDILPGALAGIGTALGGGAIGGGLGAVTGGFTSKDDSDNVYDPYVFDSANSGTALGSGLATALSLISNNLNGQGNLTRDVSALLGSIGTQRLMNLANSALFKTLNPEGFAKMEADEEDAALANEAEKLSSLNMEKDAIDMSGMQRFIQNLKNPAYRKLLQTRAGQYLGAFAVNAVPGAIAGGILNAARGAIFDENDPNASAGDKLLKRLSDLGKGAVVGGTTIGGIGSALHHNNVSSAIKGMPGNTRKAISDIISKSKEVFGDNFINEEMYQSAVSRLNKTIKSNRDKMRAGFTEGIKQSLGLA